MKRKVNDSLTLNETEISIRNLLVEFCEYYNGKVTDDKKLELRITGGWVRDKLLGNESNDLDIAINHLSGEEFASHLHDYLNEFHPESKLKAMHTIKKNPEKSKHLETCTTKLFGLDIDFVNLRSEAYTSESRVPIIECGTAEEDALRRDATLNALFYNLNENKIEDLTGKGLDDLKKGILRTPLQPLQTFIDDPLRVLRLIRFASRFDFLIEDITLQAMTNSEIKSTLIYKISRERVGVELDKILTSQDPEYGLDLINFTGLTESIFSFGTLRDTIYKINDSQVLNEFEAKSAQITDQITLSTYVTPIFNKFLEDLPNSAFSMAYYRIFGDKQMQKLFWLSVILSPFGDQTVKTNPRKPNPTHIPEIFLKEGLKYGKHDFDNVSNVVKESVISRDVLNRFFADPKSIKRSDIGLYLRKFGAYSDLSIVCSCFNDIINTLDAKAFPSRIPQPSVADPASTTSTESLKTTMSSTVSNYESLLAYVADQNLSDVHTMKLIIDGKTLSKTLNTKPGPWMGKINAEILHWQLDHPNDSQDQCLDYIKQILPNYL